MSTTLEKVREELQFLSSRISEQSRTISLSVLALCWLFLAGGKEAPALPSIPNQVLLLTSGALALASLLVDYFQYLFAYLDSSRVHKDAEEKGNKTADYNYSSCLYRLRTWAFWLKQLLALGSVGCLAVAVICAL